MTTTLSVEALDYLRRMDSDLDHTLNYSPDSLPMNAVCSVGRMSNLRRMINDSGSYFFSAGAMRQFQSRIETQTVIGGRFFITSDVFGFYDAPRKYSVRWAYKSPGDNPGIQVGTCDERFPTLAAAKAFATAAHKAIPFD